MTSFVEKVSFNGGRKIETESELLLPRFFHFKLKNKIWPPADVFNIKINPKLSQVKTLRDNNSQRHLGEQQQQKVFI